MVKVILKHIFRPYFEARCFYLLCVVCFCYSCDVMQYWYVKMCAVFMNCFKVKLSKCPLGQKKSVNIK